MLIIRAAQITVLAGPMIERLRERAATHLRAHFAEQCAALGTQGLTDAIDHGLARATAHGFRAESDLLQYLNLCFIFGRDFDGDPECAWAAAILADERAEPGAKMQRLYARGLDEESEGEGYLGPQTAADHQEARR